MIKTKEDFEAEMVKAHRLKMMRDNGPYVIRVEMWYEDEEDPTLLSWCGEFLWGIEFIKGPSLIFDHPGEALMFINQHSDLPGTIPGFEYRYRIMTERAAVRNGWQQTSVPF